MHLHTYNFHPFNLVNLVAFIIVVFVINLYFAYPLSGILDGSDYTSLLYLTPTLIVIVLLLVGRKLDEREIVRNGEKASTTLASSSSSPSKDRVSWSKTYQLVCKGADVITDKDFEMVARVALAQDEIRTRSIRQQLTVSRVFKQLMIEHIYHNLAICNDWAHGLEDDNNDTDAKTVYSGFKPFSKLLTIFDVHKLVGGEDFDGHVGDAHKATVLKSSGHCKFTSHAIRQVANMKVAIQAVGQELVNARREWNLDDLARLHHAIVTGEAVGPNELKSDAGFRKTAVDDKHPLLVPGKRALSHPDPQEIPNLMAGLVEWMNGKEASVMHPLDVGGTVHHRLLHIHPYPYGTTRLARLICSILCSRAGYPPLVMHSELTDQYHEHVCASFSGDLAPLGIFLWEEEEKNLDMYLEVLDGNVRMNEGCIIG